MKEKKPQVINKLQNGPEVVKVKSIQEEVEKEEVKEEKEEKE